MSLPPIKGFIPNTLIDWEGRVAAEIFLSGCNFRCPFCHASHLVRGDDAETIPFHAVLRQIESERKWLDGVIISGGEPTLHPTLDALCGEFKDAGFAVKLDTNGSRPEVLSRLINGGLIDFVAMDVKAALDERYGKAAGVEVDVERINASLALLAGDGVSGCELRTTVVPTLHEYEDLEDLARQLPAGVDWVLQPFEPHNCLDPAFNELKPFPRDDLLEWVERLRETRRCRLRGHFD